MAQIIPNERPIIAADVLMPNARAIAWASEDASSAPAPAMAKANNSSKQELASMFNQASGVTNWIAGREADTMCEEKPTSWHHAVRLACVAPGVSTPARLCWYLSSIALVLVQSLVMIAFATGLSMRLCVDNLDTESLCFRGSYCAGMHSFPHAYVPNPMGSGGVLRGVCHGCGSRVPDGFEIPGLLEALCPVVESGGVDLTRCMSVCLGADASELVQKLHIHQYSNFEFGCADACGDAIAAQLSPEAGGAGVAVAEESASGSGGSGSASTTVVAPADVDVAAAAADESPRAKFAVAASGPPLTLGMARGASTSRMGAPGLKAYLAWSSVVTQCDACDPSLGTAGGYMTAGEAETLLVLQMTLVDYVSLILAAVIIAFVVFREVRDINIGRMMQQQARARERAAPGSALAPSERLWSTLLGLPVAVRRYFILPYVIETVVLMVLRMGGDTVSVMLNTMATLFMLELDNFAFEYGLNVKLKTEIEESFVVDLSASNLRVINWGRRWHVVAISLICVVAPPLATSIPSSTLRMQLLSLVLFGTLAVGELIEIGLVARQRSGLHTLERLAWLVVKVGCFAACKYGVQRLLWMSVTLLPSVH